MDFSGVSAALPPMVVWICAFGWLLPAVPQFGARVAEWQGSARPGKLSALPAKNSLTDGIRKPWDQDPRISKESVACQRRAARPVEVASECTTPVGWPG